MPRNFNGSASITCAIGGASAFNFGTMIALARRTDNAAWHGLVTTQQSGGGLEAYLDIAPTDGAIWSSWNGVDHSTTTLFKAADGWCIVAATKATGTVTPRYHKYQISAQTWTHENGGTALPNATSAPGGSCVLGAASGDALNGDIAAVALYGRTFTDQEIESFAVSWEVWLSYGPVAAWLLDQDATTTAVLDWTGGGAQQTATSGTAVTAGSLPLFNQSDGGTWAAEVIAGGSTPISLTDSGTAADTVAVIASAAVTDAGSGADALAATVGLTATDTGSAADTASVAAAAPLTDTAAAADTAQVTAAAGLTDTAAGADLLGVLVTLALAEAAAGLDAVTVNTGATPVTLADTAAAADTAAVTVAVPSTDTATAADGLTSSAVVLVADTAAAADAVVAVRLLTVADTGVGADTVTTAVPPAVVTGAGGTHTRGASSTYTTGTGGASQWR